MNAIHLSRLRIENMKASIMHHIYNSSRSNSNALARYQRHSYIMQSAQFYLILATHAISSILLDTSYTCNQLNSTLHLSAMIVQLGGGLPADEELRSKLQAEHFFQGVVFECL